MAPLFEASLFTLALAALTGVLYRGAIAWGWDAGTSLVNVRHAHSHLMFFGWIAPALFCVMVGGMARLRGRPVSLASRAVIGLALVLGMVTHPLFYCFGYGSVVVGGARLPLAAVVSGLAVLGWYGFAIVWMRERRGSSRSPARMAWDLALAVLVLSTLAVWPLSALRPLGFSSERWAPVLAHAFLNTFSEGWLVLALLGVAHAEGAAPAGLARRSALIVLAVSAPLAFPLGVSRGLLPDGAYALASVASIAWGVALLAQLDGLRRTERARSWRWRIPLLLGALAAVGKVLAGATPWVDWSAGQGLRLVYLHVLLFGFVSLGVLGAARTMFGSRAVVALPMMQLAALLVIASLLPLSEAWPWASGRWSPGLAAFVAWLAALVFVASFGTTLIARLRMGVTRL